MQWLIVGLLSVAVFAPKAMAQDWPQWRGPTRDGVVPGQSVPKVWPASFKPQWRVEVGEGYSAPIVAGNRVFVHSRRDPQEVVSAVDRTTGKLLWQKTYSAPAEKNQYATKMAKGPYSTPLVAGGRLFTLGMTGILSAWNVATGELVWRKDYSASVNSSKLFCGTSMSPLMEGGALIVHVGSDIHQGRILALDPATGNTRWTWTGPGPGYASPIVATISGIRQIITLTQESIVGINAATGASLWTIPFPDEWQENIVTPVWTGKHLIISGVRQGTHAYTLSLADGKWESAPAWKNTDAPMYMSTPVLADGILYGLSNKKRGYYFALDTETGKIRWATEGRDGDQAFVLLTPSHIVYLTNNADLIVVRRTAERFEQAHRYHVAPSETWSAPVLLADGLLVRDATHLIRLSGGK